MRYSDGTVSTPIEPSGVNTMPEAVKPAANRPLVPTISTRQELLWRGDVDGPVAGEPRKRQPAQLERLGPGRRPGDPCLGPVGRHGHLPREPEVRQQTSGIASVVGHPYHRPRRPRVRDLVLRARTQRAGREARRGGRARDDRPRAGHGHQEASPLVRGHRQRRRRKRHPLGDPVRPRQDELARNRTELTLTQRIAGRAAGAGRRGGDRGAGPPWRCPPH